VKRRDFITMLGGGGGRAARRACAAHRRANCWGRRRRSGLARAQRRVPASTAAVGLDRRPVMLPPGRFRLATRPSFTGSTPVVNTMGIVLVAALAASEGGVARGDKTQQPQRARLRRLLHCRAGSCLVIHSRDPCVFGAPDLIPPPTFGECRHRGLARRCVAVRRRVLMMPKEERPHPRHSHRRPLPPS
jgi:hypothetical protein